MPTMYTDPTSLTNVGPCWSMLVHATQATNGHQLPTSSYFIMLHEVLYFYVSEMCIQTQNDASCNIHGCQSQYFLVG